MMFRLSTASALLFATLLAGACSSGSGPGDASTATDTELVFTAASVRAEAATAMADIESVAFTVTRSGAEVSIDEAGLVVFESADARFAAPAATDAVVSVTLLGNIVELGAVSIDGTLWLTDPLTGGWQDVTGTIAFDPSKIFSPTEGVSHILATELTEVSLASSEPDADGLLLLEGIVPATDVDTLTSGLVSAEAEADVLIDADTFLVERITFDTPLDDAADDASSDPDNTASWLVELSDYNADVMIEAPELGS